jgi:REP element-mobilizing transposase RayT
MILNDYGIIADQQWYWSGEQYSYINQHEFIVMPNHIHGIIEIISLKIKIEITIIYWFTV